ncbi:MAG: sodium-independent anion transporter, partial [Phycisphaerales bacterium]|nr:sodium-independent anion transporter [Phycisphaerales bacterium]
AYCMFPPVVFLLWIIYQDLTRPIAEIEPSSLVADTGLEVDDRLAVYRLKRKEMGSREEGSRDQGAGGRQRLLGAFLPRSSTPRRLPHRFPNLEDFQDRLPSAARVVVLDLMGVPAIDANSALELAGLIERLRRSGRTLLVSGLDHTQVEQLRRSGVGGVLSPEQVLPDLELAVARGVVLLGRGG